jgi:hypothetical protein
LSFVLPPHCTGAELELDDEVLLLPPHPDSTNAPAIKMLNAAPDRVGFTAPPLSNK